MRPDAQPRIYLLHLIRDMCYRWPCDRRDKDPCKTQLHGPLYPLGPDLSLDSPPSARRVPSLLFSLLASCRSELIATSGMSDPHFPSDRRGSKGIEEDRRGSEGSESSRNGMSSLVFVPSIPSWSTEKNPGKRSSASSILSFNLRLIRRSFRLK